MTCSASDCGSLGDWPALEPDARDWKDAFDAIEVPSDKAVVLIGT